MKKYFAGMKKVRIFADGKMAEWSNAAVLKTVDLHGSGGSNPSLSAREKPCKNAYEVSFFITTSSLHNKKNRTRIYLLQVRYIYC